MPRRPTMRSRRAPALAAVLAACLIAGIGASPAVRGEDDGGAPLERVGSAICTSCHQDQHARWSSSSHAHTFERATADTLPADVVAGARVAHDPSSTQFRTVDGQYRAETLGPDGSPASYHLTHVVGRMRVQMFVATMEDGRQQVLPGMLEAPTGAWFDYTHLLFGGGGPDWDAAPVVKPGDPSFWTGPVRSWDTKCARCHVSGWEPRRPEGGKGPRYRFDELGVNCEACHGPGSAHVDFRERKEAGEDPILQFAGLARDQALGMCLQCHMEAEVVDPGFRVGADIFDYRDPTLLIDPERIDTSGRPLELIYDGVPFSVSRCAQEGQLTCISCHDPHGSSHPSQLREAPESDKLCTTCHAEIAATIDAHTHHDPAGSGARCVNCHMPFLGIERGHGVVADHSISTPRFDLVSDRAAETACTWCHEGGLMAPDDAPRIAEPKLKVAHAAWYGERANAAPWMQALGAARTKQPDAHIGLVRVLADRALPRIVRASAAELLGRYAKQAPLALLGYARDADSLVRRRAVRGLGALEGEIVDAALLRALGDDARAVRTAAARAALAGWSRVRKNEALLAAVLPVLAADAQDGPGEETRWFLLGAARSLAGDERGALAAYRRQVELDPFAERVKAEIARLEAKLR